MWWYGQRLERDPSELTPDPGQATSPRESVPVGGWRMHGETITQTVSGKQKTMVRERNPQNTPLSWGDYNGHRGFSAPTSNHLHKWELRHPDSGIYAGFKHFAVGL